LVTGILACKGKGLPQTNKENRIIFFKGVDFVLFYMLWSIICRESWLSLCKFL